jgi:hypothetical protein
MGDLLLGCSGWNYSDTPEKGGWVEYSIPIRTLKDSDIIHNSSIQQKWIQFFMRFCSHITMGTFIGMARDTTDNFQFLLKVPETITHKKG